MSALEKEQPIAGGTCRHLLRRLVQARAVQADTRHGKDMVLTTVELMELKFLKRNNKLHHSQPPVSSCVTTPRLSECVALVSLNSQQFGKIPKHSFSSSQSRPRPSRSAAGLLSHLELEEDVFSCGILFLVGGEERGEERRRDT